MKYTLQGWNEPHNCPLLHYIKTNQPHEDFHTQGHEHM